MALKDPVISRLSAENPIPPIRPQDAQEHAEAERVLHRVLSCQLTPERSRPPMARVGGGALLALAAVTAVAVAAIAILAVGHGRPTIPTQGIHSGQPLAGLEASFAALRRTARSQDSLPSGGRSLVHHVRLSRRVLTTPAFTTWLVAGRDDELCLVSTIRGNPPVAYDGTCAKPATVRQTGVIQRNGTTGVLGVLPDRARGFQVTLRSGAIVLLTPNRDGVVARVFQQPITKISYLEPDGAREKIP